MGKFLQTVADVACLKTLLIILNLALWGSGLALLAAGVWMHVEFHRYLEMNTEYSYIASYALVGLGAFVMMVSTLACCCIVRGHPTLLYVYGGFVAFIVILQLIVATSMYTFKERLDDGFEKGLTRTMLNYGPEDPQRTQDFYYMQKNLQCCGNHGYEDWAKLPRPMPLPRSCCRDPIHCDVQDETQVYRDGCYDKVTELIGNSVSKITLMTFLFVLLSLIGIALAFNLAANITKNKYEQMT